MAENYVLRANEGSVELWSAKRLQFEPRGWLKEMRRELAAAVQSLGPAQHDRLLHASYVSSVRDISDVENVLFYNVGASAFRNLMRNGVRYERSFSAPPRPPSSMSAAPLHYVHYERRPRGESFKEWRRAEVGAKWDDVALPPLTGGTKVAPIWYALRQARGSVRIGGAVGRYFGLIIEVGVPRDTIGDAAFFLKPLLDGLISAFHWHDGPDSAEIASRLARQLGIGQSYAAELLGDRSWASLGERRLLWPWRNSVQWNPRDDDCVACELTLHVARDARWSTSGALFDVAPI